MPNKDEVLLSVSVALVLISEKCRFQASRTTDEEARRSLLEIDRHAKTAIRIVDEARRQSVYQEPIPGGRFGDGDYL